MHYLDSLAKQQAQQLESIKDDPSQELLCRELYAVLISTDAQVRLLEIKIEKLFKLKVKLLLGK
ncbi:hypothetical protein BGX33_007702, partial [Mortierella sp. NVP41]